MEFCSHIYVSVFLFAFSNSVCDNLKVKNNLYDKSEVYLDSVHLIEKFNYVSEEHSVVTEDGYVLKLFRIPSEGPPVLLVHGIGDSSDSWLVLGAANSLACRLADAGYDVWLYNSRGNKYSKGHAMNLTPKQYWNFSFEEMGTEDLPATIDYILTITSEPKLSYVGFSQGTTIFFIMCSMRPLYNDKITQAILLAPVAAIKNIKSPFIDLYAKNYKKFTLLYNAGVNEVFPSNIVLNTYHAEICQITSPVRIFCEIELFFNFGLRELEKLSNEKLSVITSHIPAGTSSKTFLHFLQGYILKSFRRYDYGIQNNMNMYNSSWPPLYDLSTITAPISLIISENDWFSTVEDAKILQRNLKNIVRFLVINKTLDFTHLEFVYGERVNSLINEPVLRFLKDAL